MQRQAATGAAFFGVGLCGVVFARGERYSFQAMKPCSVASTSMARSKPATFHSPREIASGSGMPPVNAFSSGKATKPRTATGIAWPA